MTTDSNIEDYFAQLRATDELADDDEDISPEELAEADAAYQDYLDGRDLSNRSKGVLTGVYELETTGFCF